MFWLWLRPGPCWGRLQRSPYHIAGGEFTAPYRRNPRRVWPLGFIFVVVVVVAVVVAVALVVVILVVAAAEDSYSDFFLEFGLR